MYKGLSGTSQDDTDAKSSLIVVMVTGICVYTCQLVLCSQRNKNQKMINETLKGC